MTGRATQAMASLCPETDGIGGVNRTRAQKTVRHGSDIQAKS
tara:strand:+ start:71476 stop:71601 length:126 start_codon:yes stop_codon:yes gene_type:complete